MSTLSSKKREIREIWEQLSHEECQIYHEMAKKDELRYKEQLERTFKLGFNDEQY